MPGSILGTEVRRVEDRELLLGQGTFVDNLESAGVAHAVFVRSPFAHARITGIDTAEAAAAPTACSAVYTADDLGREPLPSFADVNEQAPRAALAVDKVRYVGDPVALVVAETRAQADGRRRAGRRRLRRPAGGHRHGGRAGRRRPAAVRGDRLQHRHAAGPPRTPPDVARRRRPRGPRPDGQPADRHRPDRGQRDPGPARPTDGMEAWVSTQHPHMARDLLAKAIGVDAEHVRVVAPHVGGAFGGKAGTGSDHAADRAGRPQARPAGEVGRDPQRGDALDAGPRPGAVRRARPDARRHASPACGCGCSASAARTPASAARSRSDRRT